MIIRVKVKPNSSKQSVEKIKEEYIVQLKSCARKGRANLELVKFLKKYFGKEVRIKSGLSSRHKIVEVSD